MVAQYLNLEAVNLSGKRRADLFDAPDRTVLVKLAFFANECRCSAFEDPNVVVGGLLADDGGNHSGEAAELNMEDIVNGLARGASNTKGNFAGWFYRNADQPRLRGWCDKGKLCLRGGAGEDLTEGSAGGH